jgi:hypothetical protein
VTAALGIRRPIAPATFTGLEEVVKEVEKRSLLPKFEEVSLHTLQWAWMTAGKVRQGDAIKRLESQLGHRGRSYSGLQILIALMGAVEVALAALNVDKGLLSMHSRLMAGSAVLALLGLIALAISVLPLLNEVVLTYTRHAGLEALKGGSFGHFFELSNRCMHQRRVLWRTRLWFAIACFLTILAISVTIASIVRYSLKM